MRKIDRLIKYMNYKGLNDNQVTQECELSQGLLSQARSGKSDLGPKSIEKILTTYQDLDRVWLLTGSGNMLRVQSDIVAEPTAKYQSSPQGNDTQDVEIEEIANFSLPFATNDIVQSREIDIKALVESKSPKLERYPIGQKLAGVSYAQRIITEAMINADFHPGDVICLTYLEGKSQLLSGYAYLLDTKEYGALFRLVTINEDGTLLLESANPRFRAIRLHDDDVRSYARLLMMIRTNFSFNRGAQFAEIVRSRDEQIMKLTSSHRELITAQAQVLQNQAELIAEIRDSRKRNDALIDKIINDKQT